MELKKIGEYIELNCDKNDFDSNNKIKFGTSDSDTIIVLPKLIYNPNCKLIISENEYSLDTIENDYSMYQKPTTIETSIGESLEIEISDKESFLPMRILFKNVEI